MPRSVGYAFGLLFLLGGPFGLVGRAQAAYNPTNLDPVKATSLIVDDSATATTSPLPQALPSDIEPWVKNKPSSEGMASTTGHQTHSVGGPLSGVLSESVPPATTFVTRLATAREGVPPPSHLEELLDPPRISEVS